MYDEFIIRLREKAGAFDYDGRPDIACDYEQAADAIEELVPFKKQIEKGMGLLDKTDELLNAVKPRWIPVTERLPEETEKVLVQAGEYYYKNSNCKGIVVGWRNGPYWSTFTAKGCESIRYPLAWMPLPQPPKEE